MCTSKPNLPPPPPPEEKKEPPVLVSPESDAGSPASTKSTGRLRASTRRGLRIDLDSSAASKPTVGLNVPT
jgi:hypothetical protein